MSARESILEESFPWGYTIIPTASTGVRCGFYDAMVNGMQTGLAV